MKTKYFLVVLTLLALAGSSAVFAGDSDESALQPAAARQLMAIWSFNDKPDLAAGVAIGPTSEYIVGQPDLKLLNQAVDSDGKDGLQYQDFDGMYHEVGQAGAWDDIKGSGDDAWLVITLNTTGWTDLILRLDYRSESASTFDILYTLDSSSNATWTKILPEDRPLTPDAAFKKWYEITIDLISTDVVENQSSLRLRISDLDLNGNDKFAVDNVQLTGIPSQTQPAIVFSNDANAKVKPPNISGALDDVTDPAKVDGFGFTATGFDTAVCSLTVTARSSNQDVVSNDNLNNNRSCANNVWTQKIQPIEPDGVGYTTILLEATGTAGGQQVTVSKALKYAASAAGRPGVTYFHYGASDASAACALDKDYILVGNDEDQIIRLYPRRQSGPALKEFDLTNALGPYGTDEPEVDIEAAACLGDKIYWIGSHGNDIANGYLQPNRNRLFRTTVTGTGQSATLTIDTLPGTSDYYYNLLRTALVNWGDAHQYKFSDSVARGKSPLADDGFNIEGLAMAPDGTTLYIGFRAPLVPITNDPATNRKKALIAPILNFESWFNTNPRNLPTIGEPIELDLGEPGLAGRGIRSIECVLPSADGTRKDGGCIILAGPPGENRDFKLYKWFPSYPSLGAIPVSVPLNAFNPLQGAFEGIAGESLKLSDGEELKRPITVVRDDGTTRFYHESKYEDPTEAKDLLDGALKKFTDDFTAVLWTEAPANLLGPNWQWRADTQALRGEREGQRLRIVAEAANQRGCWFQDLSAQTLRGKVVSFGAAMSKTANIGSVNPYISLQVQRQDGSWVNNVGGLITSRAGANGAAVTDAREIWLPQDVTTLRASFCVWNATPGAAETSGPMLFLSNRALPPSSNLLGSQWLWGPVSSAISGQQVGPEMGIVVSGKKQHGCWYQDIAGSSLRGRTLRFEANMRKTAAMGVAKDGQPNPYLSLQVLQNNGAWVNNYGGLIASRAAAGGGYVSEFRDITLPGNMATLRASFCVWNATRGTAFGKDFLLRQVAWTPTGGQTSAAGVEGVYPNTEILLQEMTYDELAAPPDATAPEQAGGSFQIWLPALKK